MNVATFLWFNGQAEEAADYYTTLFDDSRIVDVQRANADGPATSVTFELGGQRFIAFNGELRFAFTSAISLYVRCATQDEVDRTWAGLTLGGQEGPGGSLTDRFGVTWQVIPEALDVLLQDADPAAAERVLTVLHNMTKIEMQALHDVHNAS